MGHVTTAYDVTGYRFRNDDGSETGASWKQNENVDYPSDPATTGIADLEHVFRLRVVTQETGGGSANNVNFLLQYQYNANGWVTLDTTTGRITLVASAHVANETPTTTQLASGTGSFDGGFFLSGSAASPNINVSGNSYVESEWCLRLRHDGTNLVNDGDTINFRILVNGNTISYSQTPTLTVEAGGTRLKAWNSGTSQWDIGRLKQYDGSTWNPAIANVYNGTNWIPRY